MVAPVSPGSTTNSPAATKAPRSGVSVVFIVLSFLFALLVALTALREAKRRQTNNAFVVPAEAAARTR
jgi:Na+-transporting methylmalonyl-CoA/oxaloacetate decarboxylase gamma subunit